MAALLRRADGSVMRIAIAAGGLALTLSTSGCALVAVTDAAVSVAATAVKAGANVGGGADDIARAGVRTVRGGNDSSK